MKIIQRIACGIMVASLPFKVSAQSPLFEKGACVLFQGDSITDMGRGRTEDPNHLLGHGYAFIIAAREGADFPERQLKFINRGVSGNTINDLMVRWQTNTLDLKPDVLSILIGVNDVGHKLRANEMFSVAEYEAAYDKLLASTVTALPKVKLILGEPFFAPGKSTANHTGDWQKLMPEMRAAVERLGRKYHVPVVHYQTIFNDAAKRTPISYWIWDGVHPTYAGHQLMADEWKRTYRVFYGLPADLR